MTVQQEIIDTNRERLLFREEVFELTRSMQLGSVRLTQPRGSRVLVIAAVAIALFVAAFLCLGSYTGKTRVYGVITPVAGNINVVAGHSGVLVRTYVGEGDFVKEGTPLFEISSERQGVQGELSALVGTQLSIKREALNRERTNTLTQNKVRAAAIQAKLSILDGQIDETGREISIVRERLELAHQGVNQLTILKKNGFVSEAEVFAKRREALAIESEIAALRRLQIQLRGERSSSTWESRDLQVQAEVSDAQLARAQAELDQEIAENGSRKKSFVLAPRSGTVTSIVRLDGQAIDYGQIIATIIPRMSQGKPLPLEAHLFLPTQSAGVIEPGLQVSLRYHAYPYQKFGFYSGVILETAKVPISAEALSPEISGTVMALTSGKPNGRGGGLYRVRVRLLKQEVRMHGRAYALKPGLSLEADIPQGNRRIWEWLLEPLAAVRGL